MNLNELHTLKRSDSVEYISFYTKDDTLIQGDLNVSITSDGQFDKLTAHQPNGSVVTYTPEDYTYTRETLFVLGIGNLLPGDVVKLSLTDCNRYELGYGWHTNVSNQTIYSWYLKPINDSCGSDSAYITDSNIRTLYKEYLDTIEVVEFTRNRISFYAGGSDDVQ